MKAGPCRILLVDDMPQNLAVAEAFLESLGYRVVTARTGTECLQIVETAPPDLILLDIVMP